MAFAFVVETGAGLATATSYVSADEANDYFEVNADAAADWFTLDDDKRELYLAWATRLLDQKTDWKGYPATATQALRWPRTGVTTRDGVAIGSNVIPINLRQATAELARYLIANDPSQGQDADNFKKIVVDVIEIEFQDGTAQPEFPALINAILTGLGFFRSGSRQFGKILRS